MCGIFGLVGPGPIAATEVAGMSRLLRHRGPDDEGLLVASAAGVAWYGGADTPAEVLGSDVPFAPQTVLGATSSPLPGGVLLGHRRLSILDLSPHGHQPMSYRGWYWIAYNGEVYNYRELRQELGALGHPFCGESDTEVILAAFDQWGPACLERFNGMWALAILDLERQTLFLARDRFGVKPLYLWTSGGRLAFASEVKAFTALPAWRSRVNLPRLLDFLVWNLSDHTEETMFEGVTQLPAGHFLQMDVAGALLGGPVVPGRPRRWYDLPADRLAPVQDAVASLRRVLDLSVRLRLRADVPVGSCLSGGIDSSSIVCLMSRALADQGGRRQLETFTARSDDAAFDETRHAQAVVEAARTDPTFVTPTPTRLFADLDRLVWHQDEPFVSSSIFAQWCVFEAARQRGVVVMLDGQGADEILGGYRGFFGAFLAGLARRGHLAAWWRESGALRAEIGFGRLRSLGYTAAYLAPQLVGLLGRLDGRAYADRGWLRPPHRRAFRSDPVRSAGGRAGSVRGLSRAQVIATNLPMLLHWEDRNSMAFSVEARVPFLDYRVVELALALTDEEKVGGGISKAALRGAMRGIVPDQILDRRDKMGFLTAEPAWMKRDLATRFRADLAQAVDTLHEVVDPSILRRFDEVVAGTRPFDHRYWRILCAGRWARIFSVSGGG